MHISDLPALVTAAKSDWLPGTTWLGFTPRGDDLDSRNSCQGTVQRQFGRGYVLEYVTVSMEKPNAAYEQTERFRADRARHRALAGRLVAVHKLQTTSKPLLDIVGDEEFNLLQDMWAEGTNRRRWSVAFPIVESYNIVGQPLAKEVLGKERYQKVFTQQSAVLRPLADQDRQLISDLEIVPIPALNERFLFEAELERAALSDIDERLLATISKDFPESALEGNTVERIAKIKRRSAQVANEFIRLRRDQGNLSCDDCKFDPVSRLPAGENPRSLLEVHHKNPMASGVRRTTVLDFALYCPTCHKLAHIMMKRAS